MIVRKPPGQPTISVVLHFFKQYSPKMLFIIKRSGLTIRTAYPFVSAQRVYVRAYNHKVTAVFLTILSTILGLVPFLIDDETDTFWFSFAVGSIGGLLFSLVGLVFVTPIFLMLRPSLPCSTCVQTPSPLT